jgi:hypothetical protein
MKQKIGNKAASKIQNWFRKVNGSEEKEASKYNNNNKQFYYYI